VLGARAVGTRSLRLIATTSKSRNWRSLSGDVRDRTAGRLRSRPVPPG
jgi:hypothetical protein